MRFKHLMTFCLVAWANISFAEPQVMHLQKDEKQIELFGTMHIAKPDFYPLPQNVTNALATADALAVEMDLSNEKIKNESATLMMNAAMTSTAQPIDKQRQEKLHALFGNKLDAILGGEPWFLSVAITLERANKAGYTATGIDEALIDLAHRHNFPIISLEKPAEQMNVFSQIPLCESLQLFDDAVSEAFKTELERTNNIWRNNDHQAAQTLHNKMQADTPILYNLINTKRNHTLARRIDKLSDQHKHLFVAIGAMHLYAKGSVVEQLKKRGWQLSTP